VAALLLWYENSIVKASDLTRVNAAFFTVNGVIAVIVLVGALADRLLLI
jgi:4-hydroxybenzoate polyprenyltransferase